MTIQSTIFDSATTYFYSLAISVVAAFVFQMLGCTNVLLFLQWILAIFISFFMIVLSRYAKRGQDDSYRYMVEEYEKGLLQKKIEDLEKSFIIREKDLQVFELKQAVINELINIRKKSKRKSQKEKVEKAIKDAEQLDLLLDDYSYCVKRKVYIKKQEYIIFYQKGQGKENNNYEEMKLINENYNKLLEILEKYKIVSY